MLCSLVSRGRLALRDSRNMFHNVSIVVLCGRRNTFASFSPDELQFSWQAPHDFDDLHRHFTCCVFFANRIVRAAPSGDKVQIAWWAWHFVRCAEN